jgi:hypothetical protein
MITFNLLHVSAPGCRLELISITKEYKLAVSVLGFLLLCSKNLPENGTPVAKRILGD